MSILAVLIIATTPTATSAVQAMDFIKEDIKPVVEFAMDWAMQAALAATSTHAFVVVCKRFLQ